MFSRFGFKRERRKKKIEEWAKHKRHRILVVASLPAFVGPISTTIYLPAIATIRNEFNAPPEIASLSFSLYTLTFGFFPFVWGSFSDTLGRKTMFIPSLLGYSIISLLLGFTRSIGMFIGLRVVQAIFASAGLVVGAGCLADVFPKEEIGFAMGLFSILPLLGPMIGPTIGGAIESFTNWRIMFFVISGTGFTILLIVIIFLPETLPEKKTTKIPNPLKPFKFFGDMKLVVAALYSAFVYGTQYVIIYQFANLLRDRFGRNALEIGLLFLPFGGATTIGTALAGRLIDITGRKYGTAGRLMPAFVAGIYFSGCALFWGFTAEWAPEWVVVMSSTFAAFFSAFPRPGVVTYCIDLHHREAGSVTAFTVFCQFTLASITVTAANQLIPIIGIGYFELMLVLIVLLLGICLLPISIISLLSRPHA